MLINCTIREDREKVGRRWTRVRRYFVDVARLTGYGFALANSAADELQPGDVIRVTGVPSSIHEGSLGSWRVVEFSGPYARCERVPAGVDMR